MKRGVVLGNKDTQFKRTFIVYISLILLLSACGDYDSNQIFSVSSTDNNSVGSVAKNMRENNEDKTTISPNTSANTSGLTQSSIITSTILPVEQSDSTLFDPKLSFVEQYNSYIEKLPLDDPNSIGRAINKFKFNILNDKKTNDSLYRRLNELYDSVLKDNSDIIVNGVEIYKWSQLFNALKLDYNSDIDFNSLDGLYLIEDVKFRSWLTDLLSNGYYLTGGEEESIWVDEQEGFLFGKFKECLSDGMIKYEGLNSKYMTTVSQCYGGAYINEDLPLDELSDLIIELENYIDNYSEYLNEAKKTQKNLDNCLQIYLFGNIVAEAQSIGYLFYDEKIDYDDDSVASWKLNNITIESLENFVIQYPSSKYSTVIKEYLKIVNGNGQKFSKKAEKYLEDQGIDLTNW